LIPKPGKHTSHFSLLTFHRLCLDSKTGGGILGKPFDAGHIMLCLDSKTGGGILRQ